MKDKIEMLDKWLGDLCSGRRSNFVKVIKDVGPDPRHVKDPIKRKKIINIFTNDHRYHIVAIDRVKGRSYLGCQVSTRKSLAGEDWFRGNDLPDGPFNRRTWLKILNSIVKYELVPLAWPVNYMADLPEVGLSLGDEGLDNSNVPETGS